MMEANIDGFLGKRVAGIFVGAKIAQRHTWRAVSLLGASSEVGVEIVC